MLLSISGFETLHLKRIDLHMFALEVFKCLYDLNQSFMSSTFNIKHVPYNFRDNQILTLPNFKNITYGKRSFKYYGSHACIYLRYELVNSSIHILIYLNVMYFNVLKCIIFNILFHLC